MKRYPENVRMFIEENVKGCRTAELAKIVNAKFGTDLTKSKMKSYMHNHGLYNGLPTIVKGERESIYPDNIRKFIQKKHIGIGHVAMAELLNSTFNTNYTNEQIKGYYARFKLNSGLSGRWEKGHEPFNKGKKKYWIGGEDTQFKKGNKPHNYLPVGTERVNGDDYVDVKIEDPNKWKGKHVLVWEEHNGPVPKGKCIIFGDGNNRNFNPDNLICVSRAQLITLNTNHLIQNDAELTRIGVAIVDVKHKISNRKKK